MRQVGYGMLLSRKVDAIRLATVNDDGIGVNSYLAGRRQDPDALISEPVDVRRDGARRRDPEPIGGIEIVRTRRMHIQHEDHRHRMCRFVGEVKAHMDFHDLYSLMGNDRHPDKSVGHCRFRCRWPTEAARGSWLQTLWRRSLQRGVREARLGPRNIRVLGAFA